MSFLKSWQACGKCGWPRWCHGPKGCQFELPKRERPSIYIRSAEGKCRHQNTPETRASAERAAQWALEQTGQTRLPR